jgi:flagellar motor switch protein FliM
MNPILSKEEIDALLAATPAEGDRGGRTSAHRAGSPQAAAYDFRRRDRISKDQIRSLQFLHDRFAQNVATSLSAYLRAVTSVNVTSVEQFTYLEFLMALPDPTAFFALSLQPQDGLGALELNPSVAFAMIDRMLGGSGQGMVMNRALTEIEQAVVDGVVKLILENLAETWQSLVEVHFRISARETRPQMLQVAAPNEPVIVLTFEIRIGEARGNVNLCVPAALLQSFDTTTVKASSRTHREPSPQDRHRLLASLGRMPLSVSVELLSELPARELLSLNVGDVLSLGRPAHEPLDVRVGGALKFLARPIQIGHCAGVAIEGVVESASLSEAV